MKRVLSIGIIFFTLVVLSACSNSNDVKEAKLQKEINQLKKENRSLNQEMEEMVRVNNNTNEKVLNKVGNLQYIIKSIKTEKIKNEKENYTDAEYNYAGINDFGRKYYRTTIAYSLKNIGTSPVALSMYQATILDDDNNEFTRESAETFGIDINSNSTLQPNSSTSGKFYLLSKTIPKVNSFSINMSEQFNDSGRVADAGVAK